MTVTRAGVCCRLLCLLLISSLLLWAGDGFNLALPGYRYLFPQDHFSHPSYQTEWWYYTGNLHAADGRQFGFELTFFRFRPDPPSDHTEMNPVWVPSEIYIAHFAVTDLANRRFYHHERVNRAGPGLAGVNQEQAKIWNGNWSAHWLSYAPITQKLDAVSANAHLVLTLRSEKPLVIHGQDGVSKKGPKAGEASHYYSLTRMAASGTFSFEGKDFTVAGLAWMDREFFTSVKDDPVAGWDWMCVQLNTNEELMLYQLHLKDGSVSPYSSATFVDAKGNSEFLDSRRFSVQPLRTWHSNATGADYPVEWEIKAPSRQLQLRLTTPVADQELVNKTTRSYWEGAVRYSGTEASTAVTGGGYLEMTGYERHGAR